jgi:rod shape determining protein RodA
MYMLKRDYILLLPPLILSVFGLSTIFSIGTINSLFEKQIALTIIGLVFALILAHIDLSFLKKGQFIFAFFAFNFLLLLLVVGLGKVTNGAQSWFKLFGFSLQPVELAKLALILLLAKFFYKRHVEISYLPTLLLSFFYPALLCFLTLLQPDLGSALVVLGIWGMVVFVSGISKKYILGILALIIATFVFSWFFIFAKYQKDRVLNFVNPTRDIRGSGYNVYQSMIAIGSGGVYGKGINFGTQSKLAYLPEYETDFIFSAFSEEWGFVGSVFCILVFMFLILRILHLVKVAETNFETFVFMGISAYFIIHFTVNVGMNIGLLPVTGIPLPFMSAGGTHVLVEWMMIGILISYSKNRRRINREIHTKELYA